MNRNIGYARVAPGSEDISSQIKVLKVSGCSKIFRDQITGCRKKWPALHQCLEFLKTGDTLCVQSLDRMACSMPHLAQTLKDLENRGIHFCSLENTILDTRKNFGPIVFEVFKSLARFQVKMAQERTHLGRMAARARGRTGGRKALEKDSPKIKLAKKLSTDPSLSISDICAKLQVSRASYYRYLHLTKEGNP